MSAAIKVCLVQLHCDVSAGFTLSPICVRFGKNKRGRSIYWTMQWLARIKELFVTTTAGEDETTEGNPGNRNGDTVEVAPPVYQRLKTKQLRNTPVTLYRDYTELARRCEISQNAVGSPKNAENRCNLFSIFTPWRSHGVPTAIVAFLRRFHVVLSRSCGVLVGYRLRAHGVLMACPRRAHRVLGAVTARARRAHGARTASTPFMPFRISIRIMLCLPAIVDVMSQSPALISCCPVRELNRLRS